MNKLSKILTCWIPIKNIRKRARQELELFLYNLIPLNDNWVVFYDTFSRSGNGDSIRPIAKELKKRNINLKFFFVAKSQMEIDMADEVLIEHSDRFNYVIQRAKYVISPMDLPKRKHNKQIFVNTWHGSPLKRTFLALDKYNKNYIEYAKIISQTDIFPLQGDASKDFMKETFGLKEEQFINSGFPRNDILFAKDEKFINELKHKLEIPTDKKIILYCPTWRRFDNKFCLPMDINMLKEHLSDDYILLMRSHVGKHSWVDEKLNYINIFDNKFCFDAGEYPEATHLYLIADIFISDYSSAVFDFAITKKPEILYIYDEKEYCQQFGLFYEMKNFSPFPKIYTTTELIDCIKNINININTKDYNDFNDKYLNYENGTAAKQIVDRIFECERNL